MRSIKIRAPATSANLGSGFDICGVALEKPFDEMVVSVSEIDRISSKGRYEVPIKIDQNSCGPVINEMRSDFDIKSGLDIMIRKQIKPSGGMGSSAASAAGIAYAINKLFNLGLSNEKLVHYASFGEAVSAGVPHLDNVAPAIFGGFTVVTGREPIKIKKMDVPASMEAVIVSPENGKKSTKQAREVLPNEVSRSSAQYNMQCLSSLICSVADDDVQGVIKAMDDKIAEPARARAGILQHFYEIKKLASNLGYGVAASGAGPAILILGDKSNKGKKKLLTGIESIFKEKHEIIISRISKDGIKQLG
jgi:homoserine kinase